MKIKTFNVLVIHKFSEIKFVHTGKWNQKTCQKHILQLSLFGNVNLDTNRNFCCSGETKGADKKKFVVLYSCS